MISIEPIYFNRRSSVNLRHLDPNIGVILFYGAMTGVIFYLYWRRYQSVPKSAMSTGTAVGVMAVILSLMFGIDILSALGASFIPQ